MIELKDICKTYKNGNVSTVGVKDINLTIDDGDFVAIMGTSGSGKSTLLNILGCMDEATSGTYILDDVDVTNVKKGKLGRIRKDKISFIFQYFALMNEYSVYENIEMPLLARGVSASKRKKLVNEVMENLSINDLKNKVPSTISGGQQQRTAIARALVTQAKYILADEPTGALDKKTSVELMELLKKINESGKTIIMVTHDEAVASYAKRIIRKEDGAIV